MAKQQCSVDVMQGEEKSQVTSLDSIWRVAETISKTMVEKMETLTGKMETMAEKVKTVTGKVDTIAGKVDTIAGKVDTMAGTMEEIVRERIAHVPKDTCP